MDEKTKEEMGAEQRQALITWSNSIQAMMDGRYGKGTTGNIIIIFPVGRASKLSWISNAAIGSVISILTYLAEHLQTEFDKVQKIERPNGGLWTPK